MKWWILVTVSLALFAGLLPEVARAQPTPPVRDLGNEVRDVFAAKCAVCHDSDLGKPKGRFGYVLDLRRVAGNPEKVIPFRPVDSELWDLVEHDEMPPKDSPHGALTPAQKEVIREWISAGAPDTSPLTSVDRIVRWLGKFHLLLLHFPIALVLAAGIGEIWSLWRRNPTPSESVRFCLLVGALAAIPTASLGWLHAAAGNGASSPQLLLVHRWLGTTTAVWIIIVAVYSERDARRGVRSRGVRLLLVSGVLITALTAFFGGRLAHGGDFFNY
jgi:uncharacterized membrane protein/mono/diheme cytochrome c family protein